MKTLDRDDKITKNVLVRRMDTMQWPQFMVNKVRQPQKMMIKVSFTAFGHEKQLNI